jgi:hypothetical protein
MKIQELKTEVLKWLLEAYNENPNGLYDITDIVLAHGFTKQDVQEIGKMLVSERLVQNQQFRPHGEFVCQISIHGIDLVSNEIQQAKYKLLEGAIQRAEFSALEILELEPKHFQKAHAFSKYFQDQGLIECVFMADDIHIKPTMYGRSWFEDNTPRFVP